MAVPPFVGADAPIGVYQLVYSLVFFAAALFIALRPEKLTDRLGKILCPILVALIVVTFVGCLVNPLEATVRPPGTTRPMRWSRASSRAIRPWTPSPPWPSALSLR